MRSFVWVDMDVGGDNAEEIISHTAEHYTALGLHFHNAKCDCIVQLYDTQCTMS